MKRFFFLLLIVCAPWMQIQAQEDGEYDRVEVTVERMNKEGQAFFEVHANGFVRATPQDAWQVLTDYDRLHEFVPNLLSSKLISRSSQEAIVEQHGQAGFLFIRRTIHLMVRITEQPFSSIDVVLIAGDMKHYAAHWELVPSQQNSVNGTRIIYSGTMEPDFFVPPLFGRLLMQADVKKMVEATVTRINQNTR